MYTSSIFFTALLGLLFAIPAGSCEEAKAGAAGSTLLAKNTVYLAALDSINIAFAADQKEHAISFGRDNNQHVISSGITNGTATAGKLEPVLNAFADLHNHPNNTTPDAGDLYGLIDINKNNAAYGTRYVVTKSGIVYALLVTNATAAAVFNRDHPRQQPAASGLQPAFPAAMVDEFRAMKYQHGCSDEMVLAFMLEKYQAGIALLRQDDEGKFKKIYTVVTGEGKSIVFTKNECP
jgi:hypothetical protein